jgi:hypothetical protein
MAIADVEIATRFSEREAQQKAAYIIDIEIL